MSGVGSTLATVTSAIAAVGALGTAAYGMVDASKAFNGGVSNFGYGYVLKALTPFASALDNASSVWRETVRANWINGMAKDDQKSAAKSLVRLGLSSQNAKALATAGHVDPDALLAVLKAIETGAALTTQDAQLLGRFNASIDVAMDAGFERGDQKYRNGARLTAGFTALALSVWGGAIISLNAGQTFDLGSYLHSASFGTAVLVGLIAVPIAPVAKDLASSLQAAVTALQATKP